MFKIQPTSQEYSNPLKWGWYFVEIGRDNSGLMSKRAAKAYRKAKSRETTVHCCIKVHNHAPALKLIRRATFPIRALG